MSAGPHGKPSPKEKPAPAPGLFSSLSSLTSGFGAGSAGSATDGAVDLTAGRKSGKNTAAPPNKAATETKAAGMLEQSIATAGTNIGEALGKSVGISIGRSIGRSIGSSLGTKLSSMLSGNTKFVLVDGEPMAVAAGDESVQNHAYNDRSVESVQEESEESVGYVHRMARSAENEPTKKDAGH